MLTLSEIARRHALDLNDLQTAVAIREVRAVDGKAGVPVYDERRVLAIVRPEAKPKPTKSTSDDNWPKGIRALLEFLCPDEEETQRLRLASLPHILGKTKESKTATADRLGVRRESLSRVIREMRFLAKI